MLQRLYWVLLKIEASLAPAKAKVRAEAKADQNCQILDEVLYIISVRK